MDIFINVKKSVRVWSFDGGGRGVLSQLVIVDKLMRHIQLKKQLSETPRPCDHAEVMIGSGLGGAAAILMGRMRLTASETYDEIVQLGQTVFVKPNASSAKPLFSLDALKSAMCSILERHGYESDMMMIEDGPSTEKCHAIVLASSKANATGYKSLRTYSSPKGVNCTVVDAIAATMAAPDWFDPVTVGDGNESQVLVGGPIGYNNPTWEGLLEAKEIFGIDARVTSVISIGSGKVDSAASVALTDPNSATNDSNRWVERMSADCEQTAIRLSGYFRNIPAYIRITMENPVNIADIFDWDEGAAAMVNGSTASYLERVEVKKDLDGAVANLLQEAGTITLGHITKAAATRIGARSVPRLTPYYVPRPEVYHFMNQSFAVDGMESQKTLIVHGMAGSGKTQSASFFERKNRKRYKHVFFIDASSVTSIKADLQSAVRSLGGFHSQDTYEGALQYLKSTESGHWLVIFDNADDPNLPLNEFIPSCNHGHIIVTTRNPDLALPASSSHLRMPNMSDAEALAVLFLAAHSSRPESETDNKDALEICRIVGHLPLVLVQVGCYCFSSQVSFAHYLERFREHRLRLMKLRPSWQLDEYPYSAYTSISLSYSLLDDDVKSLFHLLAFFHPFSIHLDIFRTSAEHHFEVDPDGRLLARSEQDDRWVNDLESILLKNGKWDQTRMDELLMRLQSLSLVSLAGEDDYTIATIHPLVQSFTQDILSADNFNRFLYMTTRTLSGCIRDEHQILFRHLLPHIYEVESHLADPHLNDLAASAYLFETMKLSEESLKRWRKVKVGCEEWLGSEHMATLFVAARISVLLGDLGDYEAAVAEITSAVAIQEKTLGRDHDNTAELYLSLAILLQQLGKLKETESILQKNLQISQNRRGKEHPRTLLITSRIGDNLYHQGRFDEAEIVLSEVIPTMTRVIGQDHIETSKAIARFCRVLIKLGRWAEAETQLQHQLQWRVKRFGVANLFTVVVLRDLAICSRHRGDLKEAEKLQRFVLEFRKKENARDVGFFKHNAEAQNALEETLQLIKQTKGKNEDDIADRVSVWNRRKVEFVILSGMLAVVAALIPIIQSSWSYAISS